MKKTFRGDKYYILREIKEWLEKELNDYEDIDIILEIIDNESESEY